MHLHAKCAFCFHVLSSVKKAVWGIGNLVLINLRSFACSFMFIITQEGSTSRCQSYLTGKLEFIQMFIFSGIEFFEEIKEALVEKMCFQIFGDILLKCWCKCQVRSTDTTRFSVSEI